MGLGRQGHPDLGWTKGARVCSAPWRQQNPAEHGVVLAEPQAAASGMCRDPSAQLHPGERVQPGASGVRETNKWEQVWEKVKRWSRNEHIMFRNVRWVC